MLIIATTDRNLATSHSVKVSGGRAVDPEIAGDLVVGREIAIFPSPVDETKMT